MEITVDVDFRAIFGEAKSGVMDEILEALCLRSDVSETLERFYGEVSYDEKLEFLDSALSDITDDDLDELFGKVAKSEDWNLKVEDVLQSMKSLESAAREAVSRINRLKR